MEGGSRDFSAEARESLGDRADVELRGVTYGDLADALIALAALRGFAWANPNRKAREYVLDQCDLVARSLGLEEEMRRLGAQAMEGRRG